jgi:hypothetical protein
MGCLRKVILVLGISSFMSWLKNCVSISRSVQGFHEYFITGNCDNFPSEFQQTAAAVNTLIISTAECEQVFSTINTAISCVQSSVLLKTEASLMFISSVCPPISKFNPENYE